MKHSVKITIKMYWKYNKRTSDGTPWNEQNTSIR
jgi:hypothetical protein